MIKATFVLIILAFAMGVEARNNPDEPISHYVSLEGLAPGEGRYLRVDVIENEHFKSGYYFCANRIAYSDEMFYTPSDEPFHKEYNIKLSLCQDETLTQCQEFGTDNYTTYRNADGYLENDVSTASFNIAAIKNAFQACEPNPDVELDNLVTKSLHLSDRRFAHVG